MFYLYFMPHTTTIFACSYLLHVLYFDALRRQIEIETEYFLKYGYNAGPPMAIPIHTVLPYCAIDVHTHTHTHAHTHAVFTA